MQKKKHILVKNIIQDIAGTGRVENDQLIGKYGVKNNNGDRLIKICRVQKYKICNTLHKHKDIHP